MLLEYLNFGILLEKTLEYFLKIFDYFWEPVSLLLDYFWKNLGIFVEKFLEYFLQPVGLLLEVVGGSFCTFHHDSPAFLA